MDAAEHVIKSKAEIRQVLLDYDQTTTKNKVFATGKASTQSPSRLYDDPTQDAGAMAMNIEMNKEMSNDGKDVSKDKTSKKKSGSTPKKSGKKK